MSSAGVDPPAVTSSSVKPLKCFKLHSSLPDQPIIPPPLPLPLPLSPLPPSPQLLDMKVFVDTDSDIRLVRRLKRDISLRGRDISGIIKQYNKFVKPAFEQYIEPTVQAADIVVPRGQ